ncbi:proprotein convertase P-domain-containing protein [Hymenobacter rubidus]|uniref:proprotein convertase P-domain-containing protein n=1 Tax=Hymenobacter rubidus TaxID=1441626 RepID=UPI00191E65C8|nr:proprotein convertase P-domain-containing protein [Hymenobacter rubidus]
MAHSLPHQPRVVSKVGFFLWAIAALWLISGIGSRARAQVFFGKSGPVTDFTGRDEAVRFPLVVEGLAARTTAQFGLEGACLSITHPKTADLKIELLAPDGTSVWLTNRNGGDHGADYRATCFRMDGFNGYVYEGKSPFTGTYIPDGKLQFFNQGLNPNGTWYLLVHDLAAGNAGSLDQWSLSFGPHPAQPDFAPCNPKSAAACRCPDGTGTCDLLPDLVVSEKILRELHQEYGASDATYPRQIRLAVATANIGWGPMETRGTGRWTCGAQPAKDGRVTCPDGQRARQEIVQVIYRREGDRLASRTRVAGSNYFDERPGHNHYHADAWVDFTLRRRLPRQPDPRRWPVLGKGTKASYCLFDSGNCGEADGVCQNGRGQTVGQGTLPNFGFGHYVDCEAATQGISVGGIDHYGISFEGQAIPIPMGTPNGSYYIVVEVDPLNLYQESDETNNVVAIPIELKLQSTATKSLNTNRRLVPKKQ